MDLLFAESSVNGWGTEQHFAALAIAMMRREHRVRCMISEGSPLEEVLRAAGVPVALTPAFSGGTWSLRRIRLLRGLMAQRRPDWMVTNDSRFYWPMILTGRTQGVRTALFRHWERMSRSMLSRRLMPRLADRFILVSQFQRNSFRKDGVNISGMQILYNPIDTQRFHPSPEARARVRAGLGISESTPLIGYVGRIVRIKGVFELFEAAGQFLPQVPEARVLWVGDGADQAELRARVAQSPQKDRHLFHGFTQDLTGLYNAIDVLVVPSVYPDPCPRVPVEAQACGTPVVCNDSGGLRETFRPDFTGKLVPAGQVEPLSAAILALARDPALRRAMGEEGRRFVCSNFSFENIALNFEAVLANKQFMHQIPMPGPVPEGAA